MKPIGHLRSCYPQKFGVPRQPGLVPAAWGELIFEPEHRRVEAVAGLEEFSHVWLITQFHLVPEEAERHSVRPPRLGGNEKRGVWATRSPFRPNRLGLSLVKLEEVVLTGPEAPTLRLSGVDCVSGTPVYDIKPYLPYCEAVPEARSGFAHSSPHQQEVDWTGAELAKCLGESSRLLIHETLSLSLTPAYLEASERVHHLRVEGYEVAFVQLSEGAQVISVRVV